MLRRAGGVAAAEVTVGPRWQQAEPELAESGPRLRIAGGCRPGTVWVVRVGPTGAEETAAAEGGRPVVVAVTPPLTVPDGGCTVAAPELSAAAELAGELAVPRGMGLPERVRLEITPCAVPGAVPEPYPVELNEAGAWRAWVPAGCVEASLRSAGFAPLSWKGLSLRPSEMRALGRRALQPAAALSVQVRSGADGLPLAGAEVALFAEGELQVALSQMAAGHRPPALAAAVTDDHGWVRFPDLVPAVVVIAARRSGAGPPTLTEPLELVAGDERVVDLELARPGRLELAVGEVRLPEALTDGRLHLEAAAHFGSAGWRVVARRDGPVGEAPELVLPEARPGRWRLAATLVAGEAGIFELGHEELELAPGEVRRLKLELADRLYRGVVTYRGAPLAARLDLRPLALRHGQLSPRTVADEEGRFWLLLAAPAVFDVRVYALDGSLSTTMPEVAFDDPDEPVVVRLPEGEISGSVVDGEGRLLAEAQVTATRRPAGEEAARRVAPALQLSTASTGAGGDFTLDGLAAGRWQLRARHRGRAGAAVEVVLGEDEHRSGLRLTVGESVVLSGRVTVAGQPVRGVRGWVSTDGGAPGPAGQASFASDADGAFRVELPQDAAPPYNLVLAPPGGPVSAVRTLSGDGLGLALAPLGGRLELVEAGGGWTLGRGRSLLLVSPQGGVLPLAMASSLAGVAFGASGPPVIPSLAPGVWQLVEPSGGEAAGGAGLSPLATFELAPGQALRVELPGAEARDPR